jgi:hypothetical protein
MNAEDCQWAKRSSVFASLLLPNCSTLEPCVIVELFHIISQILHLQLALGCPIAHEPEAVRGIIFDVKIFDPETLKNLCSTISHRNRRYWKELPPYLYSG